MLRLRQINEFSACGLAARCSAPGPPPAPGSASTSPAMWAASPSSASGTGAVRGLVVRYRGRHCVAIRLYGVCCRCLYRDMSTHISSIHVVQQLRPPARKIWKPPLSNSTSEKTDEKPGLLLLQYPIVQIRST